MAQDADVVQSRIWLSTLEERAAEILPRLEMLERRCAGRRGGGSAQQVRLRTRLRDELAEINRLIDGIESRYPTLRLAAEAI